KRIAERKPNRMIIEAVEALEKLGFKRHLLASEGYNLKKLQSLRDEEIREVMDALKKTGQYKRLMATGKAYPRREEFEEWIARQDLRRLAEVLTRLAVLAETKVYLFWEKAKPCLSSSY
ncbi:hypothetical protein J7K07_02280, partial [Candidatus Bathyarchaeota archaeon]|nr:hypothetical protein [Candidatus Bathyarchaeota archaeon]